MLLRQLLNDRAPIYPQQANNLVVGNLCRDQFCLHAIQLLSKSLSVTLNNRYASRAQLTNTGDPSLVLPSYYVADVILDWNQGSRGLSLYVNNATNSHYYGSGHVSGGEARYYVLPPANVFLLARVGM